MEEGALGAAWEERVLSALFGGAQGRLCKLMQGSKADSFGCA